MVITYYSYYRRRSRVNIRRGLKLVVFSAFRRNELIAIFDTYHILCG